MRGQSPVNSWRKWFCFPLASNCHPLVKISSISWRSRVYLVLRTKHALPRNISWRSRVYLVLRTKHALPRNISWRSRIYLVLRTKHALPHNISWRSRLVWSRARDWKSRNRQKRFKSSNLFFSANQNLNRTLAVWFRFFVCKNSVRIGAFRLL